MSDLLDDQTAEAGDRFGALAATFDGWTRSHLESLGLGPGWACWEVGAGGPAVPAWLAERVGPAGHVVATDLDTAWMPADAGFTLQQLDVAADAPPEGPFDLVHARLVLTDVSARDEALRRMAGALRPGGWLVIGDSERPRPGEPVAQHGALSSLLFYAWSHGRNFHRDEIEAWLRAAGFEQVESHRNERSPWRIVVVGRRAG